MMTIHAIVISILLHLAVTTLATEANRVCDGYDVDLLRQLTSMSHRQELAHLNGGPIMDGVDSSQPVYQFNDEAGAQFDRKSVLNKVSSVICDAKQLTLYSTVFFRDIDSGGVVMEALSKGMPLLGLYVYPLFHEVAFTYKHQDALRTETFQVQMSNGTIYQLTVFVDGNQLIFYVNCEERERRLIPIPDYCSSWAEPLITVGEGKYAQEHRNGATGFSGSIQSVGIHAGQGGVRSQCPDVDVNYPSSGHLLSLIEEVNRLTQTVNSLRRLLQECDASLGRSCFRSDCIIEEVIIPDGDIVKDYDGRICVCQNGNGICHFESDIDPIPEFDEKVPPSDGTSPSELPDCPARHGIRVPEGGVDSVETSDGICAVIECKREFGSLNPSVTTITCSEYDGERNCSKVDFTDAVLRETLGCCGICEPCQTTKCGENMFCVNQGPDAVCMCNDGYDYEPLSFTCEDRNECDLGVQAGGHKCIDVATCVNTDGSYNCTCPDGYNMFTTPANFFDCEDIDECAEGTARCPLNSNCINTLRTFDNELGYMCSCPEEHELDVLENACKPICSGGCENGDCVSPNECICYPGFRGPPCLDIDECSESTHNCTFVHEFNIKMECHNTPGGYFCGCPNGLQLVVEDDGTTICEDFDECSIGLHNCPSSGQCSNLFADFSCDCSSDSCEGACVTPGRLFKNNEKTSIGCTECECNNGEFTCEPVKCDCMTENFNAMCCPMCHSRQDTCYVNASDSLLALQIGQMHIDPNNRCNVTTCTLEEGRAVLETTQQRCRNLSCPLDLSYTPEGACCPICELPECDGDMVLTTRSCTTCQCRRGSSDWECSSIECDPLEDCPKELVFQSRDQCCPICKQEVPTGDVCTA